MFTNKNKCQVVRELEMEVLSQLGSANRRHRCMGRINAELLEMVKNAPLEKYSKIAYTKNGNLNKGYIMESLVLDYNSLENETPYCEVKYFGNDTPNVLINNDTRLIYIVVNKRGCKGAFIIRDMKKVRGARLTLEYLLENDLLNHHCVKLENYLGL